MAAASGRHSLRFCAKSLERDAGFGSNIDAVFFNLNATSIRGSLRSALIPSDLQRHEIGPGGEVMHMSCVGVGDFTTPDVQHEPQQARRVPTGRRAKTEATTRFTNQPFSAMLYSCGKRPAAAQSILASALNLPPGALRCSAALHMPGVSVQHVALPRGLPVDCFVGERGKVASEVLEGGILSSSELSVALGATPLLDPKSMGQSLRSMARRKGRVAWKCEGHRYSVVIRNLDERQCSSGVVEENMDRIAAEGFLNLFELSSFGFAEVRRYEIGAALWTGRWDLAARLLLIMNCGGNAESSSLSAASHAFQTGDLARGIDLLPETACGLRSLATHLLRGQPALQALQLAMPIPVWSRYLSAVAKLAFNNAAASRLSDFPPRPVEGDLVWDESAGEPRPISLQEVSNYRLADVVLPLPRRGEPVPECPSRLRIESVLRQLVQGDDADPGSFPRNVNTSLPSVRRLICVPTDVSHDIVEAEAAPLVECDLTRLGFDASALASQTVAMRRRGRRSAASRDDDPSGLALRMRFSLPRSGCAESLIRELLRSNPSEFHKELLRRDEIF